MITLAAKLDLQLLELILVDNVSKDAHHVIRLISTTVFLVFKVPTQSTTDVSHVLKDVVLVSQNLYVWNVNLPMFFAIVLADLSVAFLAPSVALIIAVYNALKDILFKNRLVLSISIAPRPDHVLLVL